MHARHFYETEALRGGWSVRQLGRQIDTQFYERTALSRNKGATLKKGALARPEYTVWEEISASSGAKASQDRRRGVGAVRAREPTREPTCDSRIQMAYACTNHLVMRRNPLK